MLLRKTIIYLPAQLVGPLAQFLAGVVWTFWFSPSALGTYALIWAIQELMLLAVLSWWSSFALRYLTSFDTPERRRSLDGLEIAVQLGAAVVQTVLIVIGLRLVLDAMPGLDLIAATITFCLTRNLTSHFADRARASSATLPYTILQSVGSLFGLILGIVAVETFAPTPEVALWSYTIAQMAGLAIALPLVPTVTLWPRLDRSILREAWTYGAPLLVGNALGWVASHAVRLIVGAVLGPAAVGLVSVGWWLGLRGTTFAALLVTGAAFTLAVERIREVGPRNAMPQVAANASLLLAVLIPTLAGIMVFNHAIVDALVAEPFRAITKEILPLAVAAGTIRLFRQHATDQCFTLFERPELAIYVVGLEAVLTTICCYVGLEFGGLTGAVAGCLVAAIVTTLTGFTVARLVFGYYLVASDLLRIGFATTIMVLALEWLPVTTTRLGLLVEIGIGAAVFGTVMLIFYPRSARAALASFLAGRAPSFVFRQGLTQSRSRPASWPKSRHRGAGAVPERTDSAGEPRRGTRNSDR